MAKKTQKIAERIFLEWTCGYGVKPLRPLVMGAILILLFGLVYFFFGKRSSAGALVYQRTGENLKELPWKERLPNCFYFSVVTFTTIGYGDIKPQGKFKAMAVIEGTLGWLTMALFLVTLANVWL